jgi:hypothetical protein
MTNSGDLIVIPEWVDRAVVLADGEMVDHPLKGRGGDLLLSNELHHFDDLQVVTINLPGGGPACPTDNRDVLLNRDIESVGKGESNYDGTSQYNEVQIAAFPTSTHVQYGSVTQVLIDDQFRSFIQEIIWRVRTNSPDYIFHREFGCNIEDLVGEWNTRAVADYALEIMSGQLLDIEGLKILQATAYPTRDDSVVFVVRLEGTRDTVIDIRIAFDFEEGLVISGKKLIINDGVTVEAS